MSNCLDFLPELRSSAERADLACEALGSASASPATHDICFKQDWNSMGTHTVSSAVEAALLLKISGDLGDIKTLLGNRS